MNYICFEAALLFYQQPQCTVVQILVIQILPNVNSKGTSRTSWIAPLFLYLMCNKSQIAFFGHLGILNLEIFFRA